MEVERCLVGLPSDGTSNSVCRALNCSLLPGLWINFKGGSGRGVAGGSEGEAGSVTRSAVGLSFEGDESGAVGRRVCRLDMLRRGRSASWKEKLVSDGPAELGAGFEKTLSLLCGANRDPE